MRINWHHLFAKRALVSHDGGQLPPPPPPPPPPARYGPVHSMFSDPVWVDCLSDTSVHLPYVIIPADFSPWNVRDYYRYTGGLTTPTCNEVVVWTVFKKPQKISPFQVCMS